MTAVVLWRRMKFGYGLALTVAAVQLIRSIALTVESAQSATIDSLASYLIGAWVFPAFLLISVGIMYWERRKRA